MNTHPSISIQNLSIILSYIPSNPSCFLLFISSAFMDYWLELLLFWDGPTHLSLIELNDVFFFLVSSHLDRRSAL